MLPVALIVPPLAIIQYVLKLKGWFLHHTALICKWRDAEICEIFTTKDQDSILKIYLYMYMFIFVNLYILQIAIKNKDW